MQGALGLSLVLRPDTGLVVVLYATSSFVDESAAKQHELKLAMSSQARLYCRLIACLHSRTVPLRFGRVSVIVLFGAFRLAAHGPAVTPASGSAVFVCALNMPKRSAFGIPALRRHGAP